MIVKDPVGNIVVMNQVPLGSDRTYSYSLYANDSHWQSSGTYSIFVQFGSADRTAQTTFQFVGSNGTSSPPSSIVTVTTDLSSYKTGDTIIMSGHITNLQGSTAMTIRVFNPLQNVVLVDQLLPSPDGSFNHVIGSQFTQNWLVSGTYTIMSTYGLNTPVNTTFQFTTSMTPPTTTSTQSPSPANSTSINSTSISSTPSKIPNWVKAIFGYYAQGNLSDDDLIKALQFLVQQGIIKLH